MEVLYHKVHTALEIMKLLINEVYCLGINERECSWNRLKAKLGDEIEAMKIINKYHVAFQSIIDYRHLNTHQGFFQDKKMEDVNFLTGYGLLKLYNNAGFEPDEELKKSISTPLIDYKLNQFRKEKLKLIKNIQKIIYGFLKRFFLSLNEEYNKNLDGMKHT